MAEEGEPEERGLRPLSKSNPLSNKRRFENFRQSCSRGGKGVCNKEQPYANRTVFQVPFGEWS
jgi:hypothetical protein